MFTLLEFYCICSSLSSRSTLSVKFVFCRGDFSRCFVNLNLELTMKFSYLTMKLLRESFTQMKCVNFQKKNSKFKSIYGFPSNFIFRHELISLTFDWFRHTLRASPHVISQEKKFSLAKPHTHTLRN